MKTKEIFKRLLTTDYCGKRAKAFFLKKLLAEVHEDGYHGGSLEPYFDQIDEEINKGKK